MILPPTITAHLAGETGQLDTIGKSGSSVLLFPDKVLKVQSITPEVRRETQLLSWLWGKLPVPQVLAYEEVKDTAYLLMTRIPGEMACADRYMADPELQARLLAQALKLLWQVDINQCPADQRLQHKLAAARYRVAHGLVDMEDVQPDTFGPGGFRDPEELLGWLCDNQPMEKPMLSHGDFCLPNIFFCGNQVSGFIDLGRGGIGDKWNDIALCFRSLHDNFGGTYTGTPTPGYDPDLLFRELGIEPDWEKIRYYILLDELF